MRLSAGDAKLIAEVAETEKLLSFAIEWLWLFPQLRKKYRKLVKLHDNLVNYEPGLISLFFMYIFCIYPNQYPLNYFNIIKCFLRFQILSMSSERKQGPGS